jgi:hypothetical protein
VIKEGHGKIRVLAVTQDITVGKTAENLLQNLYETMDWRPPERQPPIMVKSRKNA